jgi:hypothetical protein
MPTPDNILKALKKLGSTKVLVGIPSGSNRKEGPIDNATLGFIHERGSPAQNIPKRPFLVPGVENSRDQWQPYLRAAATAALRGDDTSMTSALESAGAAARDAVKMRIIEKIPPPVTEQTVRRSRSAGRRAGEVSGATPLVDTAQLLNSITYAVEDR